MPGDAAPGFFVRSKMFILKNITKIYNGQGTPTLFEVNMNFPDSGLFFILGRSGSGKTTLLNLLTGIDVPSSGNILLNEESLGALSEKAWDDIRNRYLGIVFQDFNLIPEINVYKNLELVLDIQEWENKTKEQVAERINKALEAVGMADFADRKLSELSGGEIQRVAIARALVKKPRIIFADEPTGNLDEKNSEIVFGLLKEISKSCLVIAVTHDRDAAFRYGTDYYDIVDGRLERGNSESACKEETYQVKILKDNIEQFSGACVARHQMLRALEALLVNAEDKQQEYQIYVAKNNAMPKEGAAESFIYEKQVSCKRLPFGKKCEFAKKSMQHKGFRTGITILIMALTMMLLILCLHMKQYDKYTVMYNYFVQYENKNNIVEKQVGYEDSFGDRHLKYLKSGKELYNRLLELQDGNVGKYIEDVILTREGDSFYSTSCQLYMNCAVDDYELVGDMPHSANEIVLTDFVAREMNLPETCIGEFVSMQGTDMIIVGVLKTDYQEKGLEQLVNTGRLNEYDNYLYTYYYNVVVADEDFVLQELKKQHWIYSACTNIIISNMDRYFEDELTIGDSSSVNREELIEGRFPLDKNEIVVSLSYADAGGYIDSNGNIDKSIYEDRFFFYDIADNEYFKDIINIYAFLPEQIKVVGIYNDYYITDLALPEIVLEDHVYERIAEEYYKYFCFDGFLYNTGNGNYKDIVSLARTEAMTFEEPSIEKIEQFSGLLAYLANTLIFVLVVLSIIAFLMIYNNALASIAANQKNIGILRVLGVKKEDTMAILCIEAGIIFALSAVLSVAGTIIVIRVLNEAYKKEIAEKVFDICYFSCKYSIIIMACGMLAFAYSVLMPLRRFMRKSLVQIIRNQNL